MKRLLSALLSLSLSGIGPALHVALADDGGNLRALSDRGTKLDESLQLLVRRAKYPGTPGTVGGIPSDADLQGFETDFGQWRLDLEKVLGLPNAPTTPQSLETYVPVDAKLRAVNLYFNELSSLTTLRIALHQPHGADWRAQLALHLPKSVMTDFPGLGASAQNRLGDRFFPLVVDRGQDGQADPVTLKISETLVQGLEVGNLSDAPSEQSFLTLVQYLATRQLLQNLGDLRYLKADRNTADPEIPAALRAKLETMGVARLIQDEQRRAVAEPGARTALGTTFRSISGQLPAFVTPEFIQGMLKVVSATATTRRDAQGPLTQLLTGAETDNTQAALEQEIAAASLPLSAMPETEMLPSLRYFLANAKANTMLNKLLSMMSDGIMALDAGQRAKIMDLIEARKKTFSDQVTTATLKAWRAAAQTAGEEQMYTNKRNQFVENLLVNAPKVNKKVREAYSGDTVDPSLVARSFAKDLAKMDPRQSVKDWLYEIAHESNYIAARDKYSGIVGRVTSPKVLVGGLVNSGLAYRFIEHHDFTPDIHFSPDVNADLAAQLTTRVTEGRKKDLQNLITIGDWMGFNNLYPLAAPKLNDILRDQDRQSKYYDTLEESIISQYPVLATEVTTTTSDGGSTSTRLADALVALNPDNVDSVEIMDASALLVDQALMQVEQKIIKDIKTVGEAENLTAIEKVVTSSVMLELVMQGFPEFRTNQEAFVQDLLEPSLTHQIMHKYVGWYLGAGFGALMILHLSKKFIKKTGPVVDIVMMALEPFIKGYMRSAMVLILADTAYQAHELYELRERRDQTNDFFFSGAQGRSFFDYGELQGANSAYQWSKWFFIGRMVMDTAFMYFPMLKGVVTQVGARIAVGEFVEDVKAFETLGLKPGAWTELDSGIEGVRGRAADMTAEQIADAERGYLRLTEKLKAGLNWDLDAIRSEKPLTPIDIKLKKILNPQALNGAPHA